MEASNVLLLLCLDSNKTCCKFPSAHRATSFWKSNEKTFIILISLIYVPSSHISEQIKCTVLKTPWRVK